MKSSQLIDNIIKKQILLRWKFNDHSDAGLCHPFAMCFLLLNKHCGHRTQRWGELLRCHFIAERGRVTLGSCDGRAGSRSFPCCLASSYHLLRCEPLFWTTCPCCASIYPFEVGVDDSCYNQLFILLQLLTAHLSYNWDRWKNICLQESECSGRK